MAEFTKIINIQSPKVTQKFTTQETIRGVDPELWKLARHEAIEQGVTIGEVFNRLLRTYFQGVKK